MVISNTSAVDIKTHAVSPEFIFNTSFKKFFFRLLLGKESAKATHVALVAEFTYQLIINHVARLEHFCIKRRNGLLKCEGKPVLYTELNTRKNY
jgi:hypothetical protein